MHDKNAGLAVILALLLLCAVLATGCITEPRGAPPGDGGPLISPPEIPQPPPVTIPVPGSQDLIPAARGTSITEPG